MTGRPRLEVYERTNQFLNVLDKKGLARDAAAHMSDLLIRPGSLVHAMDHYVADLFEAGTRTAYVSLYSIAVMPATGPGRVAMVRIDDGARTIEACVAETAELGRRMQQRLATAASDRVPPAGVATPVYVGAFRLSSDEHATTTWTVEWGAHQLEVAWPAGDLPFLVDAPAGTFHPTRDYLATMSGHPDTSVVMDGRRVPGAATDHPWFTEVLGRTFSTCHLAVAEVALEVT